MLGDATLEDDDMWQQIISEVDANGDGEIDLKEFEAVLLNKL
jgi:Ca2+-binding EF-hand superfamily protein